MLLFLSTNVAPADYQASRHTIWKCSFAVHCVKICVGSVVDLVSQCLFGEQALVRSSQHAVLSLSHHATLHTNVFTRSFFERKMKSKAKWRWQSSDWLFCIESSHSAHLLADRSWVGCSSIVETHFLLCAILLVCQRVWFHWITSLLQRAVAHHHHQQPPPPSLNDDKKWQEAGRNQLDWWTSCTVGNQNCQVLSHVRFRAAVVNAILKPKSYRDNQKDPWQSGSQTVC